MVDTVEMIRTGEIVKLVEIIQVVGMLEISRESRDIGSRGIDKDWRWQRDKKYKRQLRWQ